MKINATWGHSTQECFQGLRMAMQRCHIAQWHVGLKSSVKARMPFRLIQYRTNPCGEQNTVQLLASILDTDRRETARELAAEVGVGHKTVLQILHDILDYRTCSALDIPWNFRVVTLAPLCIRKGLFGPVPNGRWRLSWKNRRYGRNLCSLLRTELKTSIKWKEVSLFSSSKESAPYTMCYEGDVHCGLWHWWGNTALRCTSDAVGKRCHLLYVPAAPPSSSAQEKSTTLGDTESHHSSWRCKELHRYCCCKEPLAPLAVGVSGTSTVLTR